MRVLADADAVAAEAAAIVASTIGARPSTRLVLAGGTTPLAAYRLLAPQRLPWGRVTVLFGDEYCAPTANANYMLASEALLSAVHPASVHRIPGELGAEEAAARYEPVVAAGPLDLVLLGVGEDGHTASLFPGNPALDATTLVAPVHGSPKPPADRVTLTLRALAGAGRIVVLGTGAAKADALARASALPVGRVAAEWLLDPAAASLLTA